MGICHCKFSQPNLSSISDQESLHYRSDDRVDQPVVEVLELLHDQVHLTVVVVGGEVVHPAAQTLTSIKEAIKPFEIPTSRGRTHENLTRFNFPYKIPPDYFKPCQDKESESQSRRLQPPLETCLGL